jgi:hypothetical protein
VNVMGRGDGWAEDQEMGVGVDIQNWIVGRCEALLSPLSFTSLHASYMSSAANTTRIITHTDRWDTVRAFSITDHTWVANSN